MLLLLRDSYVELFHILRLGKRGKTARIVMMLRTEKHLVAALLGSRPISL